MREITRAGAWAGFPEVVRQLGGDPDTILAAARINPAMLEEPDRYLPLRAFIESQEIAAARLGRGDFGLRFGLRGDVSALGAMAIAALNAPTAREAIDICARFVHIQNPAYVLTLIPTARPQREFLSAKLMLRAEIPRIQYNERTVASLHRVMRQVMGDGYRPRGVSFTHARVSPLSVYRECFGVTPQFGQPMMGLTLDSGELDTFLPGRSAEMRQMAETFLRSSGLPRETAYRERVTSMTRSLLLSGDCTPAQAAVALGVHERTLQRRLKAENISFEEIKDEIRREHAEKLLQQPAVPLSQIALTLGYGDSSAFTRACRRWFGAPPSAFRTTLLGKTQPPAAAEADRMNPMLIARRLGERRKREPNT